MEKILEKKGEPRIGQDAAPENLYCGFMSFCIVPFLLCLSSVSSSSVQIEGLKKSGTKRVSKSLPWS